MESPENAGAHADIEGRGDEGERAKQASPRLVDESNPGETQRPAEEEGTGVPPDEEMNRPA